jgi:hypothetical protein
MPDSVTDSRYLNCPRCGLSIAVRSRWLAIKHCPRCVARQRTVVELFGSRLPARVSYAEGWRSPSLTAERRKASVP